MWVETNQVSCSDTYFQKIQITLPNGLDFGSNCTKAITCDGPIEELNASYRKQGSCNLEQYCYYKISTENKICIYFIYSVMVYIR